MTLNRGDEGMRFVFQDRRNLHINDSPSMRFGCLLFRLSFLEIVEPASLEIVDAFTQDVGCAQGALVQQ